MTLSKSLTHGELFAGISGFGLGFSKAEIKTLWHVEIDTRCQEILRYHWPDTLLLADVKDCGAHNLPPVDIISFGSPCQDLSVAGKGAGLNGKRSGLFYEAIRVMAELKPTFAVWENVPGALSNNSGRDFTAILAAFQECGARDIAWRILDAQYFGVAQRRRRVFLVADFRGERAAEILFESESPCWDSAPRKEAGAEVTAPVKASSPSRRCGGSWPIAEEFVVTVFQPHYCTRDNKTSGAPSATADITNAHKAGDSTPVVAMEIHGGSKRKDRPSGGFYVREMPTSKPLDTGGLNPNCAQGGVVAFDWQSGGDVRLNISNEHTSALQASQTPAVQNRYGVRRLTPTEAERLQGFPDGHTAVNGMKDTPRYRMLGNAVCVPVAAWIGKRIVETERGEILIND